MRIAIIGGGISGLAAAYELLRHTHDLHVTLYEASNRFGGTVETIREGGFTIETGPDAWISTKPWARDLALELGIPPADLIPSNDATRKTHILLDGHLAPMPDGMNMMVPTDLSALSHSPLFTPAAIAAYQAEPARAAELLASIPDTDESIADFTRRHFGPEVLTRVAAPLLAGVFGGDVHQLSVRAVMPAFVAMERTHGSLITALARSTYSLERTTPIFTTLRTGLGTLIDQLTAHLTDRLTAAIPPHRLRLNTTVVALERTPDARWLVRTTRAGTQTAEFYDAVLLATSLDTTRRLLTPILPAAQHLLPTAASSAVLVAFAYPDAARVPLPPGFGFLVPPPPSTGSLHRVSFRREAEESASLPRNLLLAATFTDQKFPHRNPPGARLLRAFFGGAAADRLIPCSNDEIAAIARAELSRILYPGRPTPLPHPQITVVRRWPRSLPQYTVGHLDRIAELERRLAQLPGLTLLGNATRGVGLPDLIHHARTAARHLTTPGAP